MKHAGMDHAPFGLITAKSLGNVDYSVNCHGPGTLGARMWFQLCGEGQCNEGWHINIMCC